MIGKIPQFEAPILAGKEGSGILAFLGINKCCTSGSFGLSYCCRNV